MKKHETADMHEHKETGMINIMQQMNKKMSDMKMMDNPDRDFAEMMIIHHQAAIDMARVEVDTGHEAVLKDLANRIIEDQTKEIEEIRQWLNSKS